MKVRTRKQMVCNAAKRRKRVPAGRVDPTRTVTLRRIQVAQLRARFGAVRKALRKLVVDEDAFGLAEKMEFKVVNAFCATGEGGGVDPTCSPSSSEDIGKTPIKEYGVKSQQSSATIRADGLANILRGKLIEDKGKKERSYGIGKDGSVSFTGIGSEHEVVSAVSQFSKIRGGVFTHSHPSGGSFSPQDIKVAQKYELQEMRAVTSEGTFILGPPVAGWGSITADISTEFGRSSGYANANVARIVSKYGLHYRYEPLITTNAGRYAFQTSPEKVKLFQAWLRAQMDAVLTSKREEELWRRYAEAGYRKGAGRAFDDAKRSDRVKAEGARKMEGYNGTRDEFLRSSFGQPVAVEKVKLLAGRSFDDLKNVTIDMSTRMSRTLTDGLVEGRGPRQVAVDLARDVDISEERALVIARTEIIRAHAEGQLDSFDSLGVEGLGVESEWSTAGDDRVCPECEALEGTIYTVEEARGLIPAHPSCRCVWLARLPDALTKNRRIPDAMERFSYLLNSFCPTGEGGGVDPTCSPNEGASSSVVHKFENWHGTSMDVVENPTHRAIASLLKDNPKGVEWAQLKGMLYKDKVYVWDASTLETHASVARFLSKDDNAEEPRWDTRFSVRITGGQRSIDSHGRLFREPTRVAIEPYTSNTPAIDKLGSSLGLPVINTHTPDALERFSYLLNSFCPTGEGGGVDPTCTPHGHKTGDNRPVNPIPRVPPKLENEIETALAEFAKPDTIKEFVKYSQSVETVSISTLSSPQMVKDNKAVTYFKDNPEAIDDTEPLPLVIQYGRHMMLRDGNSRTTAAMESGRTSIRARVVYVPEVSQ